MKNILLKSPIARGHTADVYDWDEGHILKLFHDWFEPENIEYELRIARAVHASGVKTPAVKELVQLDDRNGLIYERVVGTPMLEMFQQKPWRVFQYGRMLAELHAQMHECVFNADIPHQHRKLQYKINNADALSASLKDSLIKSLNSLPEGDRVCHGDFHPANILLSDNEATVIDWIDASRGNPLADVARTTIIILGAANTTQIPKTLEKMFIKFFHAVYLREYFRLHPHGMDEYHRWLPIVAAGRLTERMPELEKWLVRQASQ